MPHGGFGGDDRGAMGIGEGIQDEQDMDEGVPYQVTMTFLPTGKVGVSEMMPMPDMSDIPEGDEEMGSGPDMGKMFPNVDRAIRHVMMMLDGMNEDEGEMEQGFQDEGPGPKAMAGEAPGMNKEQKKAGAYGR